MESKRRSVLDTPLSRGMTTCWEAALQVAPAKAGAHAAAFPWAPRADGFRNNQGRWLWVLAFARTTRPFRHHPTRRPCESRGPYAAAFPLGTAGRRPSQRPRPGVMGPRLREDDD